MIQLFNLWQTEKDKTFEDWYEQERSSYGKSIKQIYLGGLFECNIGTLTSNSSIIMTVIHRKLREKGFTDEEGMKKSFEYLVSESLKEIPYVQISSMLFASLAREASLGRKKPPTKGMMNDVETISCCTPYCDAVFIDNECRRLLNHGAAKTGYKLKARIFSQDNKDEFLKYLDEIEKSVSKKHLKKVKEVYGEKWLTPYTDMFLNGMIE